MPRYENDHKREMNQRLKYNDNFGFEDDQVEGNVTDKRLPFEFDNNGSYREEAWQKMDEEDIESDEYPSTQRPHYALSRKDQRGKGPKGWKKSDERLREEVCEALFNSYDVDASSIEVKVEDCVVRLTGFVDSRQTKKLAESCVERVSGVHDVLNELQVKNSF